jgi:hypothetical protein
MSTTLICHDDRTVDDPSAGELAEALDAVLVAEDNVADLWLEDDEGWMLSVVPSGDIFLENVHEDGDQYLTMGPLPRDEILRLLHLLAQGKIDALRTEAWETGE